MTSGTQFALELEEGIRATEVQPGWFARLSSRLPVWAHRSGSARSNGPRFQPLPTADELAFTEEARLPASRTYGRGEEEEEGEHEEAEHVSLLRPDGRWCPEEESGVLGRVLFLYVSGLLQLGYRKSLQHDDLWDVAREDDACEVSRAFHDRLTGTREDVLAPAGRVGRAMWRQHRKRFIWAGVVKLIHDIVMFLGPFLLEILLKHVQAGGGTGKGIGLAAALAGAAVLETLTVNYYFHELFRICLHLKTGLVDALYRKSLRVSAAARAELGAGAIVNLQSNDAAKLWSLPQYLHMVWSGPFQILAVMALLVRIIRPVPALVGLGVCVALIPMSALVAKALAAVRRQLIGLTDARIKLCSEVVQGIKAIKLYAWEGAYSQRITELREKELRQTRKAALIGTWNNMLWIGGPILISMAALLTYSSMGYPLTAAVAFPALSLFNLLRFPVMMFPQQLMNLVNAKVALDRIQKFMETDEMHQDPPRPSGSPAISIENGTFSWGLGAPALLSDVHLNVMPGQLIMVVGSVGTGKSSLLSAMLGEMTAKRGTVELRGRVAYTQQDPWIQNATLKNNVLLGNSLDPERYESVLEACALLPDLAVLPAGDSTEIGEKGVNLSGGQRHRVALARACYASADVYLLDDPLSAVDAHVARHLFDKCLLGLLKSKTRVLVTHHLQWLPAADRVVVLHNGRISHAGKYDDLVRAGVDFHQFEVEDPRGEEEEERNEDGFEGVDDVVVDAVDGDNALLPFPTSSSSSSANGAGVTGAPRQAELATIDLNGGGRRPAPTSSTKDASESGDSHPQSAAHPAGMDHYSNGTAPPYASQSLQSLQSTTAKAPLGGLHGAPHGRTTLQNGTAVFETEFEDVSLIGDRKNHTFGGAVSASEPTSSQQTCVAAETGAIVPPLPFGEQERRDRQHLAHDRYEDDDDAARKASSLKRQGRLTSAEERAIGRVDRQVYLGYFQAWGPAFLVPGCVLALAVVERGLQASQNWWLSIWSEATAKAESSIAPTDFSTDYYMRVYFAIGLISLIFQVLKAVTLVLGSIVAARRLQAALLSTVLRLPMSFFDSQPTGRLLNRFTKDTEAVDTSIQSSVSSFLNCAVSVLWAMVVVIAVSPGVALAMVPLAAAYSAVQKRYIATSRELKRLDSLALSPIFSHFSETLQGLATLRAFRVQPWLEHRNLKLLDESNRCFWPAQCVNRWLSVRLELIGISVVFATAVLVSTPVLGGTSAGLAGLALTSALNLTGLMNWMVRQTTELEVNMNSVERLLEYDHIPPEAPEIIPQHRPLPDWPTQGAITVENLVVRYRPELDPVLRGITFSVRPREKIGVVGRTGCGKSTLMLALYRIVEPSHGRVIIDGIDVSTIGLKDLRSRLALVPQDPVIFSGTIRSNLDPFGDAQSQGQSSDHTAPLSRGSTYTTNSTTPPPPTTTITSANADADAALWSALERAGLAAAVRAMEGGLDAQVAEGGNNLSQGQRQLLCMARALLRSARILILDEATSSIDTASDATIQATITTAFAECTVLTIAHRLHTIIASDRVLVLDAGRVKEFDSPAALMRVPGGSFKALVEEGMAHNKKGRKGSAMDLLAAVDARLDATR